MTNKKNFIMFVQIYCTYLMRDDERLSKEEAKNMIKSNMACDNRSGLSFIEKKHICSNPMFNEDGIPILSRVKEMCDQYDLDFGKIQSTVKIRGG